MTYLWQEFNIKTFPAETIVFRDGVFMENLSDFQNAEYKSENKNIYINIFNKSDLPIHIIYIGELIDEKNINIDISVPNTNVFLTIKTKNNNPAFLNIFIKNTGKNSGFNGKILCQNYSDLKIYENAIHLAENTNINISTKIIAHADSFSKVSGIAEISKNCPNCNSDMKFSAMAAKSVKLEFMPAQMISTIPNTAEHSASIYRGSAPQIEYLHEAGLSKSEVEIALREAFINDFD